MARQSQSSVLAPILARREEFRAFLVSRLGSEADADDVLQIGLVKVMRSTAAVKDDQKITAWFYQILRNSIVDHLRSRQARLTRDDAWAARTASTTDDNAMQIACRCVEAMIDDLPPRDADLVRRIELGDEAVAAAARAVGISANNASVALHRIRKKLRDRLETFCGECAVGACLDCDCEPPRKSNADRGFSGEA
jgi:RNA polymerase sigma factor (sigma-70 family)